MMDGLKDVQGIIWDLDGTLYRFDELFKTACNHAAAKAACKVNPTYIYDEAFAKCVASEQQYGFSLYWFHEETKMAYEDMHFVYHDMIDETVIEKNDATREGLLALKIPSVLLTNSSHSWVNRILRHLNLDDIFGDGNIFALEDAGFKPKSRTTAGFEIALARLGLPADKVVVIEDLPRNLITAKGMGLKTLLLHHGQIPDDTKAADFLCFDVLEVLDLLKDNIPSPDISIRQPLHRQ